MANSTPEGTRHTRLAYTALIAGFIAMLSDFYYMQVLSYSAGLVKGITSTLNAYNITPSNTLIASLSGASSIAIAVHLTYIMLPFALIMFAIGSIWLITRSAYRLLSVGMLFSSIIFALLLAVLDTDFYLGPIISFSPFIGVILGIISGAKELQISNGKQGPRAPRPISINPETPYSNMLVLSKRFFGKLTGDISILDMHFDSKAIENLLALISGNEHPNTSLRILASASRLGRHFERGYFDFKDELSNKGITLELRVMSENDAQQQHERLIIDSQNAFKIPPINIINKKSEHIVTINRSEALSRFEEIWQRSTKYENYSKK